MKRADKGSLSVPLHSLALTCTTHITLPSATHSSARMDMYIQFRVRYIELVVGTDSIRAVQILFEGLFSGERAEKKVVLFSHCDILDWPILCH